MHFRSLGAKLATAVLFLFAACSWERAASGQGGEVEDLLDSASLRRHVGYLASDELAGRGLGTEGDRRAAEYLVEQLKEAGLEPLFPEEDGARSFVQPFVVRSRQVVQERYALRRGDEAVSLEPGRDIALRWTDAAYRSPLPLVYLGYGIREDEVGWNDFEGFAELAGRCAVIEIGLPRASAAWPEHVVSRYRDPQEGNEIKAKNVLSAGGTCTLAISPRDSSTPWGEVMSSTYTSFVDVPGFGGALFPDMLLMALSREKTATLFESESFDPTTERGRYGSFVLSTVLDLTLELSEQNLTTRNVGGWVRGTDASVENELVTLSAHFDGLGRVGGAIMNGANDNASSVAALLEAARAHALHPSRRPVAFLFFSAEESGLLGSHYFLESPPVPIENLIVNVNYEMVGGNVGRGFNVNGTTSLSSDLRPILDAANDAGPRVHLDFKNDRRNGGGWVSMRSDHFNFFRRGIPVLYFVGGGTSYYHTAGDDTATVDFRRTLDAARLALALARKLGDRDGRPRIDL